MKDWKWRRFFVVLLISLAGLGMIGGCDSGKKVVDEVSGNRAVKQYHKSKKDIEKIAEQQAKTYNVVRGEDDEKDDEQ